MFTSFFFFSSQETENEDFLIYGIVIFKGDFIKLHLGENCNLTVNGQKPMVWILVISLSESTV